MTEDCLTIIDWEKEHSWHFMSDMESYFKDPCVIESARGSWLWDVEGKRYLDGNASMWTNTFGHQNKRINAAFLKQFHRLTHTTKVGRGHLPAVLLARKLSEATNHELSRVFITNNGSTANETAVKMSFQYWQLLGKEKKTKVLSMEGGHHGLSFGGLSIGDFKAVKDPFRHWCFESIQFSAPAENPESSLKELEDILKEKHQEIACLIMESGLQAVQGSGFSIQPPAYLKQIKRLCNEFEVHLILDEVFTGAGRLGTLFACQSEGVYPDFLSLGKGISAGYLPMGVTLTKASIYEAFKGKTFMHGHTYGGNPLTCAVALENIKMIEEFIETGAMQEQIEFFSSAFFETFKNHPNIKNLRHLGMTSAIELEPGIAMKVCNIARKNEVWIRPYKNSIFFVPPLNIKKEEILFLFNVTLSSINQAYEIQPQPN